MGSAPEKVDPLVVAARGRALRELVALAPEDAFTHFKYGEFLAEQRAAEAAKHFQKAIALEPEFPDALRGLAAIYCAQREFTRGAELLERAVVLAPEDARVLNDLGNVLVQLRRGPEAIGILEQVVRMVTGDWRTHNNLALAYMDAGEFAAAEGAFAEALRLNAGAISARNNLGSLFITTGELERALACAEEVDQREPGNLSASFVRALAWLAQGDYARGWAGYQRRWERAESPHRPYAQPLWNGEALEGRRILLYTDEGLGDRIQFIRYARMVKQRGGHVIVQTPFPLMEVFRGVEGIDEWVELGAALPEFAVHAPLLTLPFIFGTTVETIPAGGPYLFAEPGRVNAWRERLARMIGAGEMRVGIAWQGNPHHQWDRFRSVALARFARLAEMEGVRLVSLQRGPGVEQMEGFQALTGDRLVVPTEGRQESAGDLADSAAIMANLDLVISVDTATAHLAGALGRPVWTLLSAVTDWRWMQERSDSPWYPTMRLFRQRELNGWEELMGRVAAALEEVVKEHPERGHQNATP